MSNNANAVRSYKLPDLDYESLSRVQRDAVLKLTADMNKVRAAVAQGDFADLTTVEDALDYLREKAAGLGSELPDSFVQEVRASALGQALERAERHPRVMQEASRLLDGARRGLAASDQDRYRFFSGTARAYFEKHELPTAELDRLEESAIRNPFFTPEGIEETPPPPPSRTINPFE